MIPRLPRPFVLRAPPTIIHMVGPSLKCVPGCPVNGRPATVWKVRRFRRSPSRGLQQGPKWDYVAYRFPGGVLTTSPGGGIGQIKENFPERIPWHRSTRPRRRKVRADEAALRSDVVRLASRFDRYGYRQITNLLRIEGWRVNHKRVERIWREEGLEVPRRQPKRGRLWLNDGSCIRLRPLHKNHVWSYDSVNTRTHDGRPLKLLTVLDESTRQCMAIKVARKIRAHDVLEVLADLFARHGPPEHLRSDNGPEFTAKLVRQWLAARG